MEIPAHWRLKAQRYHLEGSICPACRRIAFPPRPICPSSIPAADSMKAPVVVVPRTGEMKSARMIGESQVMSITPDWSISMTMTVLSSGP